MTATLLIGDCRELIADIPDESIDLLFTSPPFLQLRSYLPDGHAHKDREVGLETDPAAYVQTLLELTAGWRRVLAPHGSICVELGDTYAGGSSQGTDNFGNDRYPNGRGIQGAMLNTKSGDGWPMDKCRTMVPELYRVALAYGRNPLTGGPSPAGFWRVRNVVTWCRPNPPVGQLGDRFRTATSDLVMACTARDRWFDLDAVRTPSQTPAAVDQAALGDVGKRETARVAMGLSSGNGWRGENPNGVPPNDYWVMSPASYRGAHFAVMPPALCIKPILTMCPRQVCTVCGLPRRRISELLDDQQGITVGWSDCGHDSWRRGMVLDPFAGSGTTLMVADGHGRDAIGFDLDDRNLDLVRGRLGMFLAEP